MLPNPVTGTATSAVFFIGDPPAALQNIVLNITGSGVSNVGSPHDLRRGSAQRYYHRRRFAGAGCTGTMVTSGAANGSGNFSLGIPKPEQQWQLRIFRAAHRPGWPTPLAPPPPWPMSSSIPARLLRLRSTALTPTSTGNDCSGSTGDSATLTFTDSGLSHSGIANSTLVGTVTGASCATMPTISLQANGTNGVTVTGAAWRRELRQRWHHFVSKWMPPNNWQLHLSPISLSMVCN